MLPFVRNQLFSAVFAIVVAANTASAEGTLSLGQEVGEIKGWHILRNDERRGCLAADRYGDNTAFIWGLNRGVESAFVALSNQSWNWIEINRAYSAAFVFDERDTWSISAVGTRRTDKNEPTLLFDNASTDLLQKMANAKKVKLVIGNKVLTRLILDGTRAALAELMVCSFNAFGSAGADTSDGGVPDSESTVPSESVKEDSSEVVSNERMSYGSRAGMEVMILAKSGLGTSNAVIKIELTRDNAAEFCELYLGDTSSRCVEKVLKEDGSRLRPEVTGNCTAKTWTDMYGSSYVFKGKNSSPQGDLDAEYIVQDIKTGDILNASSASGYAVALDVFKALCPGSL